MLCTEWTIELQEAKTGSSTRPFETKAAVDHPPWPLFWRGYNPETSRSHPLRLNHLGADWPGGRSREASGRESVAGRCSTNFLAVRFVSSFFFLLLLLYLANLN